MSHALRLQRSQGSAAVTLVGAGAGAGVGRIAQAGAGRAFLSGPGAARAEVVFLNTAGGLTSGDRLSFDLALGRGRRACATTQTAERIYRAAEPVPARAEVTLRLEDGACLDWLPQETILFDGARLARRTTIRLSSSAEFLGIETLVLGRAAMGETLAQLDLTDRREVWRDGRRVLCDVIRLDDRALAQARAGAGGGAAAATFGTDRALASIVLAGPRAGALLDRLRAVLGRAGVRGAALLRDGLVLGRCLAPDAWALRARIIDILDLVRPTGRPRVWQA